MLLWNAEITTPLWDIFNLEKEDPRHKNIQKVEKMHNLLEQIGLHTPPFLRSQNLDTKWDKHPDCFWLPGARQYFRSTHNFTFMALHRSYIFTNPGSRTEALKAGLEILRAQRAYFSLLKVNQYKMFALVLNTFDAIILVSAIYILHPSENSEDLDDTLQHFDFCMERFDIMSPRNAMANGALNVLKAIHVRLKRALNQARPSPHNPLPTPATSTSTDHSPPNAPIEAPPTPYAHASFSTTVTSPQYTLPTISNLTEAAPTPHSSSAWDAFSAPPVSSYDFSAIAPLQPIHDLLFNDLGTVDGGGGSGLDLSTPGIEWGNANGNGNGDLAQWQFEGDFGDDSFWGYLNSYRP